MKCDFCGDNIFVGDEYYHYPNIDQNYHLDCIYKDEEIIKKELRYREE